LSTNVEKKDEQIPAPESASIEPKQPANLEEIIQNAQGDTNSKPAFLSKEERKKISITKKERRS